jgi:hypothetical protein
VGNAFTHTRYDTDGRLKLSNGATDVFLGVLLVSGSRFVQHAWQRRMVAYLASRDQAVIGMGVVGFDLSEMPWSSSGFGQEKTFMLEVIRDAWTNLGYGVLAFGTPPETLRGWLEQFRMLVLNLLPEHMDRFEADADPDWARELEHDRGVCGTHNVLHSAFGCLICNAGWS